MLETSEVALIVVDMQNDFCSKGGGLDKRGFNIDHASIIVPSIALMLKECRDLGVKVIFVRGENSQFTTSETWENRPSAKHDGSLGFRLIEPGTWGSQIVDELKPLASEPIVTKTRYSAFVNTELPLLLKNSGVKTVIFAGTTTNACVETSVRDAFVMDFNVIVASDCVASPEPELHEASLKTIAKYFGRVDTSKGILKDLRASVPMLES
ncbi:MAG: cysteine hydrolase [Thaumarchaeota archaeon]|nr:cysteine hydrolase [Nitrososphaerota archaeon]